MTWKQYKNNKIDFSNERIDLFVVDCISIFYVLSLKVIKLQNNFNLIVYIIKLIIVYLESFGKL